jgi:hypothetical protein
MQQGPTLAEIQAQDGLQPTLLRSRPALRRFGYVMFGSILVRLVMGGLAEIHPTQPGHTEVDEARHQAAFAAATANFSASKDCGSLRGEACQAHWRTVVSPNLNAAEASWVVIQQDIAYEQGRTRVSDACQVSWVDLKTAMNDQYFPIEEQIVSYAVDENSKASIDDLAQKEAVVSKRVGNLAAVNKQECKNL